MYINIVCAQYGRSTSLPLGDGYTHAVWLWLWSTLGFHHMQYGCSSCRPWMMVTHMQYGLTAVHLWDFITHSMAATVDTLG